MGCIIAIRSFVRLLHHIDIIVGEVVGIYLLGTLSLRNGLGFHIWAIFIYYIILKCQWEKKEEEGVDFQAPSSY